MVVHISYVSAMCANIFEHEVLNHPVNFRDRGGHVVLQKIVLHSSKHTKIARNSLIELSDAKVIVAHTEHTSLIGFKTHYLSHAEENLPLFCHAPNRH